MSDDVRIVFGSSREYRETEKAYILEPETLGGKNLALPKSQTRELELEGHKVIAVVVSSFIAEKEGLIDGSDDRFQENDVRQDAMSREDWFRLGATMAYLIRGDNARDANRDGLQIAKRMMGVEECYE